MFKKIASLAYGVTAYLLFLAVFLYFVAFTMNLTAHSISGTASLPPLPAALVDFALVALFGLQHSVMARPGFKRWWTRHVPQHLERSTFVLIATAMLLFLVQCWQPIEGDIWNVGGMGTVVMSGITLIGFLGVPAISFLTDHFELFGLRQVYEYAMGWPKSPAKFLERGPYKKVRHPMMLSFLVAFWATTQMSAGHLLFACLMTGYILTGIYFEERDLARTHGAAYRRYQERVPRLMPGGSLATETGTLDPEPDTLPGA